MVPEWLIGTWERTYIQRRRKDIPPHKQDNIHHPTQNSPVETAHLNKPDSTIKVRYIQTPWAFIDIRSKLTSDESESEEQPMAFAGITSVLQISDFVVPLVHWHSCLDLDEENMDCLQRWREAESDSPRSTQDTGYFQNVSENIYHEYDPDRTLLEQWVRINDGNQEFLAVRSNDGNRVLILAGIHFGYADQVNKVFVSGIVQGGEYLQKENWIVETNAVDFTKVGYALEIPRGEWKVLKGCTLPLSTIDCIQV